MPIIVFFCNFVFENRKIKEFEIVLSILNVLNTNSNSGLYFKKPKQY